jgi:type II secretory pathway component PulF
VAVFAYTAARKDGSLVTGELETADRAAVAEYLRRQNLLVVAVREAGRSEAALQRALFSRFSALDRILLTKHLATILAAGLSLQEAVDILIEDASRPAVRRLLTEIRFNLQSGQPLSATLSAHPRYFSSVFVSLVRAGESSGTLEGALERLSVELRKEYELKRRVRAAMVYPLVLLIGSLAVVALLLTVVLPRLSRFFAETSYQLPAITRLLLAASAVLTARPLVTALTAALVVGALWVGFTTRTGRTLLARAGAHLPLTARLIARVNVTRFTGTLGTLLAAGLDLLTSLRITAAAVNDQRYRRALAAVEREVGRGVALTNALRQHPALFPSLVVSMVGVGEKTGTLDGVLGTLAGFYEEEVDDALKTLVSLLEPLLLVVMGVVVGSIALAIILPIYQSVSAIR